MRFYRGVIRSYDGVNHRADVLLIGSMSRLVLAVPVSQDIDPSLMVEGTTCGVLFFAEGAAGVVVCTLGEAPTPGLELDAYGPALTVAELAGGWRDDFLGGSLHSQYTPIADGGGSVGLWGPVSGGWARLANDTVAWNKCCLWLGDNADNYATLAVTAGWVQICQMRMSSLTDIECLFGVADAARNNVIWAGYDSGAGANWELKLRVGGGAWTNIQSAVAATAAPSSDAHALRTKNLGGGVYQLEYWVDGVLLLTVDSGTYSIPTGVLTPLLWVRNRAVAQTIGWWDWWLVRSG